MYDLFAQWLAEVDRWLWTMAQVPSYLDLPDWPSRDCFDEGMNPRTAARLALRLARSA